MEIEQRARLPNQMGNGEGVIFSMVMMIAGMMTVLLAPLLGRIFW